MAVPKSSATATRVFRRGQGQRGQRNEVLSGRWWGFASINPHCNRHFYSRTETLVFDERGTVQFLVPDPILSTTLKEDDNDLTFEETWATSDYWFQSNNSAPTQHWGDLYTALKACAERNKADGFASGEQNFQIWGYGQYSEGSGTDLNGASMDTSKTTVVVDDGTQLEIGQTALIGTLQMRVTGISGSDLTVTRAMNGSSAVAHADNSDINILRWPASVERAALVQTAKIWPSSADFEPCFVDTDIDTDTDVRIFLEPYRKTAA